MDVSIIIVHYNTPELTLNCLESVFKQTRGILFEVIVVDNASTIHNANELKVKFPQITLIRSKINCGFAAGNNLGLYHANGKFILLLNSDTVLKSNAILTAYNYLITNSNVGAVTSRLVFPDGRLQSSCQRFPTLKYTLIELLRIQKFLPKKKAGILLLGAFFDHSESVSVDWIWGTFFMFRKDILHHFPNNKLDETFFMYCEDMQWCWDIKHLGYEIHLCADAEIVHFMGGSSANKEILMKENIVKFKRRNFSKPHRIALSFIGKLLKQYE